MSEKDADSKPEKQGQEAQDQVTEDKEAQGKKTKEQSDPAQETQASSESDQIEAKEGSEQTEATASGASAKSSTQQQDKTSNKQWVKEKTAEMKASEMKPHKSTSNSEATPNTATKSDARQPAEKSKPSIVTILALPLAIVAVLASAYGWQQSQQQQSQASADINVLQQQLQQQQQSEKTLRNDLEKQKIIYKQDRKQLSDQINALHLNLKAQKKRLQSLATTDREDWLLAESEYLMKLANQRLLMGKELQGAAELLTAADDILKDFDDAALHGVRKILAQEITALKSAARLDLEGVYLRLGAMAIQVEQMDLFKAPQLQTQSSEQTEVMIEGWQQRLQSSYQQAKNKLGQYIQIKRRDESYKPLLAPEKEAAIRHNLRLMFEQAQMALLAGKQKLYDQSLDKSQRWVSDYFAIDEQQVARFNQLIEELKQQTITVELPDISASSRALKTYIETIHEIPKKKPAEQPPQKIQPQPNTKSLDAKKTVEPKVPAELKQQGGQA